MRIGIVGGTGREGRGLAARWAKAGHEVFVGSRDPARGKAAATELGVVGGGNAEACDAAVVLLSVPYSAHHSTLEELAPRLASGGGRILIDITVPLAPPKVRQVSLPTGRSAALEAQALLGENVRVVATLHHVSSEHLGDPTHAIDCDVLVAADDRDAREVVVSLVEDLGLRALDAGPLVNSIALEALTPVLLHINKRYRSSGAGIRLTGLPEE